MQKTGIGWTDYSVNPIIAIDRTTGKRGWACTKISPGCSSCYSETLNARWGTKATYTPEGNATVEWQLHEPTVQKIRRAKGGNKVFLVDMSDLYHEAVPDAWLDRIFAAVWNAQHTIFQTLTKRPERMHAYWMHPERAQKIAQQAYEQYRADEGHRFGTVVDLDQFDEAVTLPLQNLWHGVSVENQRMADERIPCLLKTPAAVRFLSCEPLLEDVFLFDPWLEKVCPSCGFTSHHPRCPLCHQDRVPGISWCIIGGESGSSRRPMKLQWLESIVKQCRASVVPTFVKQASALRPGQQGEIPDDLWALKQFPEVAHLAGKGLA